MTVTLGALTARNGGAESICTPTTKTLSASDTVAARAASARVMLVGSRLCNAPRNVPRLLGVFRVAWITLGHSVSTTHAAATIPLSQDWCAPSFRTTSFNIQSLLRQ